MKLAVLYAGQGAQHAGMGKDLYEAFPAFRAVMDETAEAVDFDLKQLCFEGPDEQLSQTQFTQPCMVAFAAGVTAVLREAGLEVQGAAGLSLGEYSALHAAGVFDAKQAVSLVAFRGKAMMQAAEGRACGMAAVLGLERDVLEAACEKARGEGVVEIANFNCPGQMAIAGDSAAVDAACVYAKEAGAKRCVPLKVSGPFHTSLMKPAGDALREHFASVAFQPMQLPVYFNCLGAPMGESDSIPALLERQVQSSVYMEDTIRRMAEDGFDTFLEIGPGKVLTGFVKKTAKGTKTYSVETAEELNEVLSALKGENE